MVKVIDNRISVCDGCGRSKSGCACGLTYAEAIRSIQLDKKWMPAKTLKNYYDDEAIVRDFGEDSKERMLEETDGIGAFTSEDLKDPFVRKNLDAVHAHYTYGDVADDD